MKLNTLMIMKLLQFKQVTGLTPTQFKNYGKRNTLDTI